MHVKTYKPKKRIRLTKEEAFPLLIDVGASFTTLGGFLSFFVSSFLMSFKTFFKTRKKLREARRKHEKTLDLRD